MCKAHLFSSGNFPPLFPHPNDDDRRPQMYLKRWMIYNDNEMTNLKFIFYLRIHKQMRRMVKGALLCRSAASALESNLIYTHHNEICILQSHFPSRFYPLWIEWCPPFDIDIHSSCWVAAMVWTFKWGPFLWSFHLCLFTFDSKFPRFS